MRLLFLAACAGAVFACLSAPSWLVFLNQLGKAFTTYNIAHTMQIQPTFALGFIDELFYRPLSQGEWVFNPSINFLFFIGAAYVLVTLRTSGRDPLIRGLLLSAIFPAALAFGLVPPSWIVRTPFLGNVVHIDNTFSCALIVLTIVIAGCGFAIAARRLGSEAGKADIALIAVVCAPIIWLWVGAGQAVHRSSFGPGRVYSPLKTTHDYETAPFIWISLVAILIAAFGGLYIARRCLRTKSFGAASATLLLTCAVVFFWRHAIHLDSVGFGKYTNHAPARENFFAKSEAVEAVRKTQAEAPTRAVGLRNALFPGFNGLIGIEGIHGPDALVNPYFRDLGSVGPIKRAWEWRFDVGPLDVQRARPFFDFLNVRYYLHANTDRETLRAELSPVLQADLDVYESPTVWPRAFFVDEILSYKAPTQLMERVLEAKGPFAALNDGELARESHAPLRLLVRRRPSSVAKPARDYLLSPNGTSFTIDATGPGVAVLHETFHRRDFKATIDGKPAEVLRVNHAFRGVYVSKPGTHRIDLWYHPEGYTISLILFGIGVAMAIGGISLHRRLRPETHAHAS